jgi:hypothetical protein
MFFGTTESQSHYFINNRYVEKIKERLAISD